MSFRKTNVISLRSVTVALIGFVFGLLVMYLGLLGSIHPLGDVSRIVDGLNNSGRLEAVLVSIIGRKLFTNVSRPDALHCARAEDGSGCSAERSAETGSGDERRESTWDDTQRRRLLAIDETCRKLNGARRTASELRTVLDDNNNMYVDDEHRVLFCTVPKAACSSWRSALALLTRRVPDDEVDFANVHSKAFMERLGLASPADLNATHWRLVRDNYTKIFVVRHPFERLLSAYRDKFVTRNKWTRYFQFRYGRKIVLLYRGRNVSVRSLRKGHDVTFEEFLTFLVDDAVPEAERLNPHWSTYQSLCHPCDIKYDHVIKFETMDVDNAVILRRYFAVNDYTEFFPKRNMKMVPSGELVAQYYAKIPPDLIYKVYAYFRVDMEMFGYDLPTGLIKQ